MIFHDDPIPPRRDKPGYHVRSIERGVLGFPSKIREETQEFMDAHEQGSKVMILVELSDLYGAIRAYLKQHHPSITMADLEKMSDITERAFVNGERSSH